MSDGNKIMPTVWACVAVLIILMILIYAGTGNTATKAAVQPPIPKAGPLAQPRSHQQVGLPVDQTRAVIPPDNPQTPEENRSRPETFLRQSFVRRWHRRLRELPQSR